ncbi:MAG: hypothetical protein GWP08_08225, partial [Nitrospiraceae bacterium]|nr:hypothetical protein [Nitrospiraceae bacterium]
MSRPIVDERRSTPRWVIAIAVAFACTQPLLVFWFIGAPPEGLVSSGLHIPDSALFLHSMDMFRSGFESLYAASEAPLGTQHYSYFPLPHLWLYGVVGLVADALAISDFMAYGLAGGLGAFLYLMAAYYLLREIAPKDADRAYLLFTLSGGLGGVLYIATGALGWHASPQFDDYFVRYAMYELFEGAHPQPISCLTRFYYTLSLALCLGALTLLIRSVRGGAWRPCVWAALLLPFGVFIDLRYGVFAVALAFLFLYCEEDVPVRRRLRYAAAFAAPAALGAIPAWFLLRSNPVAIQNHVDVANHVMYLSAFLSVAVFHLIVLPGEVAGRVRYMPTLTRMGAVAAMGYLAAFFVLFCAYQVYQGNVIVARDAVVAQVVSDWALIGAAAGAAWAFMRRRRKRPGPRQDWVVLWLLGFLALSISAFGRGWFLRFGPQRMQIFLWLPLCALSAAGMRRLYIARKRTALVLYAVLIVCGVSSVIVATLCFQGPLGYRPGASPYAYTHSEMMTEADAAVMDAIGAGTVLALPPASDSIAVLRKNRVVFGVGSFNCSDQRFTTLQADVERFFDSSTENSVRRELAERWGMDYVYCSDTWPVAAETVAQ